MLLTEGVCDHHYFKEKLIIHFDFYAYIAGKKETEITYFSWVWIRMQIAELLALQYQKKLLMDHYNF